MDTLKAEHVKRVYEELKSRWGMDGKMMLMHVASMTGYHLMDPWGAIQWLYDGIKDGDKVIDEIEIALAQRKLYDGSRGLVYAPPWNKQPRDIDPSKYLSNKRTVYAVCAGFKNIHQVPTVASVSASFREPLDPWIRTWVEEWLRENQTWVAAQQSPTVPYRSMVEDLEMQLAAAMHLLSQHYIYSKEDLGILVQHIKEERENAKQQRTPTPSSGSVT